MDDALTDTKVKIREPRNTQKTRASNTELSYAASNESSSTRMRQTFEIHSKEVTVGRHSRESFFLDGCWPQLDAVENGHVEYVHSGVDLVGHVLLRLLHEPVDLAVLSTVDNHAVL